MKNSSNVESIFILSRKEKRKYYLISYILIFSLSLLFYKSLFLAICFGFVSAGGLEQYKRHSINRKKALVLKEFKEVLYSISTSFEMGYTLSTGLERAENLLFTLYKDKSILYPELKKTRLEIVNGNQREEKALLTLSKRVPLDDLRDFVDVYIFSKKTGGNLVKIVAKSTQIITEKIAIEREIYALMSQKKFEGQIIIAMPIITVLTLNLVSPDYLEILYVSIFGKIIMTIALLGILLAFILMNKLTRIEI